MNPILLPDNNLPDAKDRLDDFPLEDKLVQAHTDVRKAHNDYKARIKSIFEYYNDTPVPQNVTALHASNASLIQGDEQEHREATALVDQEAAKLNAVMDRARTLQIEINSLKNRQRDGY